MEEEFKRLESLGHWSKHYELINDKSRNHKSEVGNSDKNMHLNRYQDVTPYDKSRVKLVRAEETDYINANFVTVPQAARQYILTQGPTPATLGHFWLMVWEQKSHVIVMLNRCFELETAIFDKCSPYWPSTISSVDTYDDVELSVTLNDIEKEKHYSVRRMTLKDLSTGEERKISQFHYTAWPDHGQPDSPISLLRLIAAIRNSGGLDKMDEPTIVHCSAGIGRSGTFCLIDSILCMVENQGSTEGVDIVNTLLEMRDYRKGLIQSPVQLRFAFLCIICGVKILEQADKLHPHIASGRDSATLETPTPITTKQPTVAKKTRRSKRKQIAGSNVASTSSGSSTPPNIFQKKLFTDAMEDIESDAADALLEDVMKPCPNIKKARNEDFVGADSDSDKLHDSNPEEHDKSDSLEKITPLLSSASIHDDSSQPPLRPLLPLSPGIGSALLKRREASNAKLAKRTREIREKMKAEEEKRERSARRKIFLRKTCLYGGIVTVVVSSLVYAYIHANSA